MALWFSLHVNAATVATFSAQRRERVVPPDRICTYDVEIATPQAVEAYVIQHNYDDGAFALVAAALTHYQRERT